MFNLQGSCLFCSTIFTDKCLNTSFLRSISRSVRIKRRNYFNKFLAGQGSVKGGIMYLKSFRRLYRRSYPRKRFLKNKFNRKFILRSRVLYFKALGCFLYSPRKILFKSQTKRWHDFLFVLKAFFTRVRLKRFQNVIPMLQAFDLIQFLPAHVNFVVLLQYKQWRFTRLFSRRAKLQFTCEPILLRHTLLRRFRLIWLKYKKPWYRYFVLRRTPPWRIAKKHRFHRWARRNYFRNFFRKKLRYRLFLQRVKNSINLSKQLIRAKTLRQSPLMPFFVSEFTHDLRVVWNRNKKRAVRRLRGSVGYRRRNKRKRFFLKYRLRVKRFLQINTRPFRQKLRRYRGLKSMAKRIRVQPGNVLYGHPCVFPLLFLKDNQVPYFMREFLYWANQRKQILLFHLGKKRRLLYFQYKRARTFASWRASKAFRRRAMRFWRLRRVSLLQKRVIFSARRGKRNMRSAIVSVKRSLINFFFKNMRSSYSKHRRKKVEIDSSTFFFGSTFKDSRSNKIISSNKRLILSYFGAKNYFAPIKRRRKRRGKKRVRWTRTAYNRRRVERLFRGVVISNLLFLKPALFIRKLKALRGLGGNKFLLRRIRFLSRIFLRVRRTHFKSVYASPNESLLLRTVAMQFIAPYIHSDSLFWRKIIKNINRSGFVSRTRSTYKLRPFMRFLINYRFTRKVKRGLYWIPYKRKRPKFSAYPVYSFFFFILRSVISFLVHFWKLLKTLHRIRSLLFSRRLTLLLRAAYFDSVSLSALKTAGHYSSSMKPIVAERFFKTFKYRRAITSRFYMLMRITTAMIASRFNRLVFEPVTLFSLLCTSRRLVSFLVFSLRRFLNLFVRRKIKMRNVAVMNKVIKCANRLFATHRFVAYTKFFIFFRRYRLVLKLKRSRGNIVISGKKRRRKRRKLRMRKRLLIKSLYGRRFFIRLYTRYKFVLLRTSLQKNSLFLASKYLCYLFSQRYYQFGYNAASKAIVKTRSFAATLLSCFASCFSYKTSPYLISYKGQHRVVLFCFKSFKRVARYFRFVEKRKNFVNRLRLRRRTRFYVVKWALPFRRLTTDVGRKLVFLQTKFFTAAFFNRFLFVYLCNNQIDFLDSCHAGSVSLFSAVGFMFSFVPYKIMMLSLFDNALLNFASYGFLLSPVLNKVKIKSSLIRLNFFIGRMKNISKLKIPKWVKNWKFLRAVKISFYQRKKLLYWSNFDRFHFVRTAKPWLVWMRILNFYFFRSSLRRRGFYKLCVSVCRFTLKKMRMTSSAITVLLRKSLGFLTSKYSNSYLVSRWSSTYVRFAGRFLFGVSQNCYWFVLKNLRLDLLQVFSGQLFVYICTQFYFSKVRLLSCFSFLSVYMFSHFWFFLFSHRLDKKEPYILKGQRERVQKRWVSLEQNTRVLKDGAWSKTKTGRKVPRRIHFNPRKLLPAARAHRLETQKRGFVVDITNSFLSFYKFYSQKRFHAKKLRFFLHSKFNSAFTHSYSPLMFILYKYCFSSSKIIFRLSTSLTRRNHLMFSRKNLYTLSDVSSTFWHFFRGLSGSMALKNALNKKAAVLSVASLGAKVPFKITRNSLFILRKLFRKTTRFIRRQHRPLSLYRHLYDPIFVSSFKKKKNRFFLFTLFKAKKWSVCLNNKTSRVFQTESKLKRNQLKAVRFKKALVIKRLHSNRTSRRRRRHLFRLRKQAFQFLDSNFKKVIKILTQRSSRNKTFEEVAMAFYNNIAFLIYRLGFMGTLSASIAAVKCNWFCLDFQSVSNYNCLTNFGSIITLHPSMLILSYFIWYRNFFIRQFFQRVVSTSHYVIAKQPFFVFAFRKKYRTQYIFNKFELIKPFVLKNLKMA